MDRKPFVLLAVLSVASGIAGGAISGRILPATPAHALDGHKAPKLVQAESFQVVDSTGDVRAELCVCPEGKPGLVLIDRGYKVRGRFAFLNDGLPGLELMDTRGRSRARLSLSADGNPMFVFLDEKGITRAAISLPDRGEANIHVQDGAGNPIWSALRAPAPVR